MWLHCNKFRYLYNTEELKRASEAEDFIFKTSVACKSAGVFLFLNLRLFKRPVGRPIMFDLLLMYFGSYLILGSNIPGVFYKWDSYSDLVKKLLESDKMKKRGLKNTHEFLNQTSLSDARCVYYQWDMEFARYY